MTSGPSSAPVALLSEGDMVDGKYRIVRFLGKGAWATVYEGVNARIGRRVAIKVMTESAVKHAGIVERFEREAQAATRIDSDHVVHVFDLGVLPDGRPFIVMELLEGEDLGRQIANQLIPQERAVFYAIEALRGLADAHAAGVLHRDVKPDNIFLVKTKAGKQVVKIVDFGISKLHSGIQVTSMTQTNAVLGSPVYMSPEQCRGTRQMDHRSDLYSLGVVIFEMLTGQLPHRADTFNELMFKIALEDAKSPVEFKPDLDPELCAIVVKAMARDPAARYQSAQEFEAALVDWTKTRGLTASGLDRPTGKLRISVDPGMSPDAGLRATTPSVANPTLPAAEDSRGSGDRAMATSLGPQGRSNRGAVRIGLGVAAIALVGVVVLLFARPHGKPSVPAGAGEITAAPQPSAPASAAIDPIVPLAPLQAAETATAGSNTNDAQTTTATASSGRTWHALPPVGSSKPAPSATAAATAAATTATTATATAPPAASSKTVVDGRTIRTEF